MERNIWREKDKQWWESPLRVALLALCWSVSAGVGAQDADDRLEALEAQVAKQRETSAYLPRLHGVLRGKYEYSPTLDASRFEVRNARIAVEGSLPFRSAYRAEVDFCDETEIKVKDVWVRLLPWRSLRLTVGLQRMPFGIDAHRNPGARYFVNRSFIGKQAGDMRDVGAVAGYTVRNASQRAVLVADGGIFNGASLSTQKNAWHGDWNYSARLQFFPVEGVALVPGIQHTAIAGRAVHYTSLDFGAFYERDGLHVEAEYLRKTYGEAFPACHAVNVMGICRLPIRLKEGFAESLSLLGRYDYMGDHSDGKAGFRSDAPSLLERTDSERHRLTMGLTLAVRNPHFPTSVRLNYEKYWYPHGGAKESEQDKVALELVVRF